MTVIPDNVCPNGKSPGPQVKDMTIRISLLPRCEIINIALET